MQLRRLAALERRKIDDEYKDKDQAHQVSGRAAGKSRENAQRHRRRTRQHPTGVQ